MKLYKCALLFNEHNRVVEDLQTLSYKIPLRGLCFIHIRKHFDGIFVLFKNDNKAASYLMMGFDDKAPLQGEVGELYAYGELVVSFLKGDRVKDLESESMLNKEIPIGLTYVMDDSEEPDLKIHKISQIHFAETRIIEDGSQRPSSKRIF